MTRHRNLACQIKANKPQDDDERTDYDFENKKRPRMKNDIYLKI